MRRSRTKAGPTSPRHVQRVQTYWRHKRTWAILVPRVHGKCHNKEAFPSANGFWIYTAARCIRFGCSIIPWCRYGGRLGRRSHTDCASIYCDRCGAGCHRLNSEESIRQYCETAGWMLIDTFYSADLQTFCVWRKPTVDKISTIFLIP